MTRRLLVTACMCSLLLIGIGAAITQEPGQGLTAIYIQSKDLSGQGIYRTDAQVDFDWGYDAPLAGWDADDFSVIWWGYIRPAYSGQYAFYVEGDDGFRLYVNETRLIDEWSDGARRERSSTITLEAGQWYPIRLDYYEYWREANIKLSWSSARQPKSVIAPEYLAPGDPSILVDNLPTWTPSTSPTPSDTPAPTTTPTATYTASPTHTATLTLTPTDTATPTNTPTPTPMTFQVSSTQGVNARECPEITCDVVTVLQPNARIAVVDTVTGGVVSGTDEWYAFHWEGETAYVHSSLAREIVAATATPRPANTQRPTRTPSSGNRPNRAAPSGICTVSGSGINIRSGPGTGYGAIGTLSANEFLEVTGRNADWLTIRLNNGRLGWISRTVVTLNGPCSNLPVVAVPPPPQPVIQSTQPPLSTVPPVQSTPAPAGPSFTCNCSKTCEQMVSCDEAYFQLRNCGCGRRDGDGDGVPCETICPGG